MKLFKTIILSLLLISLVGCATTQTNNKENQIKEQVLKLLEKEYKQQFKIQNFNITYESYARSDTGCVFFFCTPQEKFETYNLKIQAVDNPIIVMTVKLDYVNKESIKRCLLYWVK
jgi:hypothetical protein